MSEVIDKDCLIYVLKKYNNNQIEDVKKRLGFKESTLKEVNNILNKQKYINKNTITPKGITFLKDRKEHVDFSAMGENQYNFFKSSKNFSKLVVKLQEILEKRPRPKPELDHQPLKVEHTAMRAIAIYNNEVLYNKKIICIGDYDSVSIALILLSKPKEILVVDIDKELIEYFNKISEEYGFNIRTHHHNFKNPLPKKILSKYDIFITDPPYAIEGMLRFVLRGIQSLRPNGIGYVALPFHENLLWTGEINYEVQKLILNNNCIITDLLKYFHDYQKADGLKSSLLRLKKDMKDPNLLKNKFYWYKKNNKNKPIIKVKNL